MNRVYNFSAGPSMLPVEVLTKAQNEMLCYGTSGMSVMEMSHRSKVFEGIIAEAESLLRSLMNIPDNYKVLFLQGGASMQFAQVPLNLRITGKADYVNSGNFANLAIKEAKKFVEVNEVASSKDVTYTQIPDLDKSKFNKDADYFHITTNNTIYGTRYQTLPETGDVPLVGDMSSNILSQEYDVSKFGIIYAGAQKNIGPAGVTIVIIREDLLARCADTVPTMLTYRVMAENGSMYNTPPTYGIYMAKLMFEYLTDMGGIPAIYKKNVEKAALLYDYLDSSTFYKGTAVKEHRSLMNVPFVSPSAELDDKFVKEASTAGFVNIKGHRSVGGMRASIYNGMPREGITALVAFMDNFAKNN